MEVDKTTISDLGILNTDATLSVFEQLNRTLTIRGKERLRKHFLNPLHTKEEITDTQESIKKIIQKLPVWPTSISNGSILVIEKMYESPIDPIPSNAGKWDAYFYKLLHGPDFSLLKYSLGHCFDFLKGMMQIMSLLSEDNIPKPLHRILAEVNRVFNNPELKIIEEKDKSAQLTNPEILRFGHFLLYRFKHHMHSLLQTHAQLDAWYSMALVSQERNFAFPGFTNNKQPYIKAEALYHLLVADAVPYDVEIIKQHNFLFLTGANMAGKSTFIKSVGLAVFLAHTGMAVPAKSMQLSVFDGLLSNINVIDNIVKGESYFFNEVQRIKATINQINDGRNWLILIDELFKGTNIQDAMKCSLTVIEGLLKIQQSIFILSTHLYEIADDLKQYPNINFRYFETSIRNEELYFNYQLRDGVSNDRMGYLILKQQGVIDLINKLKTTSNN